MYIVGIPKEIKANEKRVSLIPKEVKKIVDKDILVYIQSNAGLDAGFSDNDYIQSGAIICNNIEDIYNKANIIVKVKEPLEFEYKLINEKHIIYSFFHFASSPTLLEAMINSKTTCIAYETIQLDKTYPILAPMSKIAGEQAMINADNFLNKNKKNIITIIGVGNVGKAAANKALELGYNKINLIDKDFEKLKELKTDIYNIYEMTDENLLKLLKESNIIIGSIYNTGEKAKKLISNEMLELVPINSIIMDVAIDQGGITEQSKPTTIDYPIITYKNANIYCVPNIPANVPHEASCNLSEAIYPYLELLLETKNLDNIKLKSGLNINNGVICHKSLL